MKKLTAVILFTSLFLSVAAWAEKTNIADTFPNLGRGVRPLGMGNAFITTKGTDENVLFYNPAAIRDFSNDIKFTTGLPIPQVEVNYAVFQLVKDIFDFNDDIDAAATNSVKIDLFNTFIDAHIGKFYSLETRIPLVGAYNRYFAVSLINDARLGVSFRNRAFPNFELKAKGLSGLAVGSAYGLIEDTLTFGLTTKVLYGAENEQIITTNEILSNSLNDFKWQNWKRGLGVGFDIGAKYEIPSFGINWVDTLRPTVGVTYQDVGNTRFFLMKKNGGPANLQQSVSAGFGFHPRFGDIETSLMFDFREINQKKDFLLKTNLGAEARFPKRFGFKPAFRGGLNQGYPTFGAGLEIWKLVWNVAFFGKEVGGTTRQRGGYRIANEFTFRF